MIRRCAVLFVLLFPAAICMAQQPAATPSPEQFLGYKLGDRFTPWNRIVDYFSELARRSPLITVSQIGETYEGRPLMLAIVTSEKNRARLDEIRHNVAVLASGEGDSTQAASLAKANPAVAWLAFGIHGNESSSAESAMRVASTLVSDPAAQSLLDDLVVIIDPLQNPDGRERYVQWFARTRGAEPNPNPDAAEHAEPWPGGRYNHYLIDMNRDWAWMSQRETQARVAVYRQWNPQVFVDFHEMGANSTYFFPPDAKPLNANLPRDVEKWLEVFGRANAQAFSQRGWPFFVSETFDLFYPAYGDSWPSLHGAVGMTYEVAGGGHGGTAFRRDDDTILYLAHRIDEHYTSGMTTLRTAAANREALLRYMHDSARAQIDGGKNTYLLLRTSPNFEALVDRLQRQGVRVEQLRSPLTVKALPVSNEGLETRTFAPGTAVVTTRQPLGRLAETLLEKSATFSPGFLEEQEKKTRADEPNDFYDLTSWSMPLAFGVPAYVVSPPITADTEPYSVTVRPPFHAASYGYLVDALEPNVYRFAGRLLAQGVNFNVSEDEVTLGEKTYSRGSIIVLKGNNGREIDSSLEAVARASNVGIVPLESGWAGGTALGSEKIHYVRDPRIALVGGAGVNASSYGMLWHTLDVDTPVPHTVLDLASLRNADLSHYRVLVLPDGNGYSDAIGKNTVEKLKSWVRDGGTIVAINNASKFLRDKDVEISKLKPWEAPKKKDDDKTATVDDRYVDYRIPGSTFRTKMNDRSFLTFGLQRPPAVLIEGTAAYQPVSHMIDNIVTIESKDPLLSGVAWPESINRIKGAAYLVSEPFGRGQVITFADEPNFRSFWRGTLPLFLNSVIYSPSFPR